MILLAIASSGRAGSSGETVAIVVAIAAVIFLEAVALVVSM